MSCLGYALLHPLQLERTLHATEITLALDDGADIAVAAMSGGAPAAVIAAYAAEFDTQVDQVASQFEALTGPGGPLADLASFAGMLEQGIDVVAVAERVADFLCDLQPAVVSGWLGGLLNRVGSALPILDPTELATRIRTLATAGVATFEARTLAGDTSLAAHRGYRAAAAIRLRLEPVLDRLDELVEAGDLLGSVQGALDELPSIDDAVLARARQAGCALRDQLLPLLRCAASFGAPAAGGGGPESQPDSHPDLAADALPVPHDVGGWLWLLDLAGNVGALVLVIKDSVRTANPPGRFMQLIFTDIVRPGWILFRGVARAFRWDAMNGPDGTTDADERERTFLRFLFSDLGDFAVQFVIELFGSVHDMIQGWANWISSIGLRLVKYYTNVVQPRTIYLFARSADWVSRWSAAPARVVLDEPARAAARLDPGNVASEPLQVTVGEGPAVEVTFAAGDTTPEAVAARIDAVPGVVARVVEGNLVIETEATGRDAALDLSKGTGTFPSSARPGIPLARYAWLVFGPAALGSFVAGLFFGWLRWEQFNLASAKALVGPLVTGGAAPLVSLFLTPLVQQDGYHLIGPGDLAAERGQAFALQMAAAVVMFIATQTLKQSAPSTFVTVLSVLGPLLFVGLAIPAGLDEGAARGTFFALVLVSGILMSGVLTSIVWWFIIADGDDRKGVFTPLRPATSPYRLPYPAGDSWLCGQNSHGFFSHQMFRENLTTRNFSDHFAYDLNEGHGSTVLAARTGLVIRNRDTIEDGSRDNHNIVEVQHLDWVEHHDPGTDLERGITYSEYLHLAHRGTHAHPNQLVRQGLHIAASDDTGNSAMNHLHWAANTGQASARGVITIPALFREGRPRSLRFYRSQNTRLDDRSFQPVDTDVPLDDAGTPSHKHTALFTLDKLDAGGAVPASVTLLSGPPTAGPRHRHELVLTRAQVERLLRHRDPTDRASITSSEVDGHRHVLAELPTVNVGPGSRGLQLTSPPPATLVAGTAASIDDDYDLLGRQMVVRVDDRATEWHSFGAHRAKTTATLTLDRGPARNADVEFAVNGIASTAQVPSHLMARAASAHLGSPGRAVRAEPVLVIETRRRGRDARLLVRSTPDNLTSLTAGTARGSGTVTRLDEFTPGRLRNLINDALRVPGSPPPAVVATLAGSVLALNVAGQQVSSYTDSTGRIEQVMAAAAPTGVLTGVSALPLTAGTLALVSPGGRFEVPIAGAPARAVLDAAARTALKLDAGDIAGEPLAVKVRDDTQLVPFQATDSTPEAIARRIMANAEGVRAWADGAELVIETVAVGEDVRLELSKGTATFAAATPGAAPDLSGASRLADSTCITLGELKNLIDRAHAVASRAAAPATARVSGGTTLRVEPTAGARVSLTGSAAIMAALGVATPSGSGSTTVAGSPAVEITGLAPTFDLRSPGWLDVAVDGAGTWRVDVAAEPARVEVLAAGMPPNGQVLGLTVNGAAVNVSFAGAHNDSLSAVAARIEEAVAAGPAATARGVTVRVAYRYAFEGARHNGTDIGVGGTPPRGAFTAGVVGTAAETGRGRAADPTAVMRSGARLPTPVTTTGRLMRAFSATNHATIADRIDFAAADGGTITIGAADAGVDPLGIAGASALRGGPFPLRRESVAYTVAASGTTTTVELNAAPAHVHSAASLGPDTARFAADAALPLEIETTDPAGTTITSTVDLRGIVGAAALAPDTGRIAAAAIQREAPHVRCWFDRARLNVDTRGGGTGWRLVLRGELALLGLGFDPARLQSGAITAEGRGNVRDGAAVTRAEVRDIFHLMGGLATLPGETVYDVDAPTTTTVRITSPRGAVAIAEAPGTLRTATVAGGLEITTPVALHNGWIRLTVGGQHAGSAAVWGRRAVVEAPGTLNLAAAGPATLTLEVDGSTPHTVPVPVSFSTEDDLVAHLNRHTRAAAWFTITGASGSRQLRIESRTRGRSSQLKVTASAATLGFPMGQTTSSQAGQIAGDGSAGNLAAVTAAELEAMLDDGRNFGGVAQRAVAATAGDGKLRLATTAGTPARLTGTSHPHGLAAPAGAPSDTIEYNFAGPIDTGPHLTEIAVADRRVGTTRRMRALLMAEPARVGPMTLPRTRADLNSTVLRLTVGTVAHAVTFAGIGSDFDVIDQIQRGTNNTVRAAVDAAGLRLESGVEGESAVIVVDTNAATSTAFTHLGAPPAATVSGDGNVDDAANVVAAEYAAIVNAGFLGPESGSGTSSSTIVIGGRSHARLQSRRRGCDSALELLPRNPAPGTVGHELATPPFGFEVRRARGPAVRASVALAPFVDGSGAADTRTLNGDLVIRVNDNPAAAAAVTSPVDVRVTFAGTLTAAEAAAAIDAALTAAGAGSAGAYPDQSIVIETSQPGLTGSITVPSPAGGSTAAVVTALGLGTALTSRGWPGAGFAAGRVGYRGHTGDALEDVAWRFAIRRGTGTVTSGQVEVAENDAAATVVAALDVALRDPPGQPAGGIARIGFAAIGDDGALYVELDQVPGVANAPDHLEMSTATPPTATSFNAPSPESGGDDFVKWIGGDVGVEPAFELRRTDVLRTFRMIYFDHRGHQLLFDPALVDPSPAPAAGSPDQRVFDVGWVRPPTNDDGVVAEVSAWADGRWLLAARAEGARSDTGAAGSRVTAYGADAEMIRSGGSGTVDGRAVHFVKQARYWVELTRRRVNELRVLRIGSEYFADVIVR